MRLSLKFENDFNMSLFYKIRDSPFFFNRGSTERILQLIISNFGCLRLSLKKKLLNQTEVDV